MRNIVNTPEIDAFIKELKEDFNSPLLHVYLENNIRKYMLNEAPCLSVDFAALMPEEKEMVKQKQGVYQRVLISDKLRSLVLDSCDKVCVLVIKSKVLTDQDVTNLTSSLIGQVSHSESERAVFYYQGYVVIELRSKEARVAEGAAMNNCLGTQSPRSPKSEFYSLRKEGERKVCMEVVDGMVMDIRERFDKPVTNEEFKTVLGQFFQFKNIESVKPKTGPLDCLIAVFPFSGLLVIMDYCLLKVFGSSLFLNYVLNLGFGGIILSGLGFFVFILILANLYMSTLRSRDSYNFFKDMEMEDLLYEKI